MEYSLKRKSLLNVVFYSSSDPFTDSRWLKGSYCLNYHFTQSTLSKLNDNYLIKKVSYKGGEYMDYYYLENIFVTIEGRRFLVVDKNEQLIYINVETFGKPTLIFDGSNLVLYEQLDGKRETMSIPALSGIMAAKRNNYLFDPLPNGEYSVNHPYRRQDKKGMIRNGVGFSMDVIPKFSQINGIRMQRTELRIHPDGNNPGSAGCIALSASKEVLNTFYLKMTQYISKYGNVDLTVYDRTNPNAMSNKHLTKKQVDE